VAGRLIAIEGLDGVGKTTLSRDLAKHLGARWLTTPGLALRDVRTVVDTVFADAPIAAQLFYASTVVAAGEQARRHLDAGQDVIMDRYWLSTVVYARARGSWLELPEVAATLQQPSLTLVVDLVESARRERLFERGASALDLETLTPARSQLLRSTYTTAAARLGSPWARLDLTGLSRGEAVLAALEVIEWHEGAARGARWH